MNKFAALIAVAGALTSWAAAATPLITLQAIHALSHAEAAKSPQVTFEATVTYRRAYETTLFVQDGDVAIYVWAKPEFRMTPGDRVLIRGTVHDSFRPIVSADAVTVLGHGSRPTPTPANFDQLIRSERDCMLVTVRAKVLSADPVISSGQLTTHMQLLSDGGILDAYVNSGDRRVPNPLLDAEVEVVGVASARFDGKMQHTGVGLAVHSLDDIKVIKGPERDPWKLPLIEMDQVLNTYHVKDSSARVRVHGTITFYQAGSAIVLQNGPKSLWIMTSMEEPLQVGNEADVVGFPDAHFGFLTLTGGEVQEAPAYHPVQPLPVTRSQLTASRNVFDLVSLEGQVVSEVREASQDEYVLISDGEIFSAILRHSAVGSAKPAPLKELSLGARVKVTGICVLQNANPFGREVPFDILMRSPEDIEMVARPSLLNVRNLTLVVTWLIIVIVAVGARAWTIERRMRRQAASLAAIEHRRSRILEDINGARPLMEIMEQIAELVSFKLGGAPSWCQVAEGARLGTVPFDPMSFRVVEEEIPARSGPPLGTLFAAFKPESAPEAREAEALSMGAGMATLAIETRRLYADLLHRSEFDQLTDIDNRFSLDKLLDAQIEKSRAHASIFGLIYIDLDEFKQVNDRYGHHIGDLYLQEAALRMKGQLRSVDTLARLGGDEFAALVTVVRNRAEVEEIALRLEHSFNTPMIFEGISLHGSASIGISLFPENGKTKDLLLKTADAAMYEKKRAKRQAPDDAAIGEKVK
jgi:diguanylate cyclase (GGDEF)-like protein